MHFWKSEAGGIALSAGLLFGVLVVGAGGALDYSSAVSQKRELQAALDSGAIAAAKLRKASPAERLSIAEMVLNESQICRTSSCALSRMKAPDGAALALRATADIPTSLLNVLGMSSIRISVDAAVAPATDGALEVAMMLDYSGSMSWSNKYVDMADAAVNFIDSARAAGGGEISLGIVPFSKYVLAPIDGAYLYDVVGKNTLSGNSVVGCVLNREYPHSVNADTPNGSADEGSLWPVFSYALGSSPGGGGYSGEPVPSAATDTVYTMNGVDYTIRWVDVDTDEDPSAPFLTSTGTPPNAFYTLHGGGGIAATFVGAANVELDMLGILPWNSDLNSFGGYAGSGGWSTGIDGGLPANFNAHKLAEDLSGPCADYATNKLWLRPLSDDFDGMSAAIKAMRPIGLTNIALALDFGWHMLTGNKPYEAEAKSDKAKKIAILLTDGMQTVKAHGPGNSYNVSAANSNIAESCTAMKADGVEVYTIAFGISDGFTRDLLKNCASSAPYYFEPMQGSELDGVFSEIFESIAGTRMRLTL